MPFPLLSFSLFLQPVYNYIEVNTRTLFIIHNAFFIRVTAWKNHQQKKCYIYVYGISDFIFLVHTVVMLLHILMRTKAHIYLTSERKKFFQREWEKKNYFSL